MTVELRQALIHDTDLLLDFMSLFNQEENIDFEREEYRDRLKIAFQSPAFAKILLVLVNWLRWRLRSQRH